jgi:hypothetical protein
MDGMELRDHDGAYKCFVLASPPQLEHMNFSLSPFQLGKPLVGFGHILLLVICVTFIFVVEAKEAHDLRLFLLLVMDIIAVVSLSLVQSIFLLGFDLWVVVEHFELCVESMFVL